MYYQPFVDEDAAEHGAVAHKILLNEPYYSVNVHAAGLLCRYFRWLVTRLPMGDERVKAVAILERWNAYRETAAINLEEPDPYLNRNLTPMQIVGIMGARQAMANVRAPQISDPHLEQEGGETPSNRASIPPDDGEAIILDASDDEILPDDSIRSPYPLAGTREEGGPSTREPADGRASEQAAPRDPGSASGARQQPPSLATPLVTPESASPRRAQYPSSGTGLIMTMSTSQTRGGQSRSRAPSPGGQSAGNRGHSASTARSTKRKNDVAEDSRPPSRHYRDSSRDWNEPCPKGQRTKLSPLPPSLALYTHPASYASPSASQQGRPSVLTRVTERPPASVSAPPTGTYANPNQDEYPRGREESPWYSPAPSNHESSEEPRGLVIDEFAGTDDATNEYTDAYYRRRSQEISDRYRKPRPASASGKDRRGASHRTETGSSRNRGESSTRSRNRDEPSTKPKNSHRVRISTSGQPNRDGASARHGEASRERRRSPETHNDPHDYNFLRECLAQERENTEFLRKQRAADLEIRQCERELQGLQRKKEIHQMQLQLQASEQRRLSDARERVSNMQEVQEAASGLAEAVERLHQEIYPRGGPSREERADFPTAPRNVNQANAQLVPEDPADPPPPASRTGNYARRSRRPNYAHNPPRSNSNATPLGRGRGGVNPPPSVVAPYSANATPLGGHRDNIFDAARHPREDARGPHRGRGRGGGNYHGRGYSGADPEDGGLEGGRESPDGRSSDDDTVGGGQEATRD